MSDSVKAGLIRVGRILLAQVIGFAIQYFSKVNIPALGISVGALISGVAKIIRDQFNWDWLPV